MAIGAVGVAIFALALSLDRPVASWVHFSGLDEELKSHWRWLIWIARRPGNILTFTVPVTIYLLIRGRRWRMPAAFVLVAGIFSGANALVKWIVGRARPFQGEVFAAHPFVGGWHGIGGANQSFPSGDVTLAAVTATSLYLLFPRWWWIWAGLVLMVAAERVAEGAHYPSDVVAGAAFGCFLGNLAWRMFGCPKSAAADIIIETKPPPVTSTNRLSS